MYFLASGSVGNTLLSGLQLIQFARESVSRLIPALRHMESNQRPEPPTRGSPMMDSSSPGASAITSLSPVPNLGATKVFVGKSLWRGHPSHLETSETFLGRGVFSFRARSEGQKEGVPERNSRGERQTLID